MFRNLAQLLTPRDRNDVFLIHPLQLSRWLDEAWASASTVPSFGHPTSARPPFISDVDIIDILDLPRPSVGNPQNIAPAGIDFDGHQDRIPDPDVFTNRAFPVFYDGIKEAGLVWDHLIYAYLIESTGVFEVMAEVVRRLVVGETLNTLSAPSIKWLRSTEELFFRDPPLFSISGAVSEVRPDDRINRRNAVWRMFAMDLPHPVPARWAGSGGTGEGLWKSDIGGGVNSAFREKWTELLRQVWLGIENARNDSGPNATDREYVALLVRALKDMMNMRRRGGQLAREEFIHVSTMAWFHLTLESDSPIVKDLRADATSEADRLAKIAQLVGMQPAARSRELFELADLMSTLLRVIELGDFDTGEKAETLYVPLAGGVNEQLLRDMNRIIDLWQSATGDRIKDRPIGNAPGTLSAQPLRIPTPGPATAPAGASVNGHR
jgi:hypothetical protein